MSDIILEGDQPRTIPLNFGSKWFCSFKEVDLIAKIVHQRQQTQNK